MTLMSLASSVLGARGSSTSKASSDFNWGSIMAHDVGTVVLRHLASTADSTRTTRLISKDCRQLVDSRVHGLKANLSALSSSEQLTSRFPRLRRLSFERLSSSSSASQLLTQLVQQQPKLLVRLQELDLSSCHGLEADVLVQLLRGCSGLRSLALPPLASSVQSNRHDFVEAITTHAGQLTQLLGAGDYICPASVQLLPQLSQLQSLDIAPGPHSSLLLTPAALQPLKQLHHLQRLQLGNHLARYDTFLLAGQLPQLSSLVFEYADDSSASHADLAPLMASSSLQELQLCNVICSDEVLGVLARTRVSRLTLRAGRFCASRKGAAALAQQLLELQMRVNDADMQAFAAALPALTGLRSLSLSVHRASESCTELMQAIFSLPQLQSLALSSHYNGLKEAEASNLPLLPSLQRLSLSNHFNDTTLQLLLRAAPSLRSLKLSSCSAVSDAGLTSVPQLCSKLREVHLELMRGAGAAGVAALAAGRCVVKVVVEGCRNVSAQECRRLQQQLAGQKLDLEIVKLK